MKLRVKLLHLVASFKSAWFSLSLGLVLIVFSILFLLCYNDNSQVLALFVGIIASILATIILRISDKYTNSYSSYLKISDYLQKIIRYIDNNIKDDSYDSNKCSYELWEYYMLICQESNNLTYDKDFISISLDVDNIMLLIKTHSDIKSIERNTEILVNKIKGL